MVADFASRGGGPDEYEELSKALVDKSCPKLSVSYCFFGCLRFAVCSERWTRLGALDGASERRTLLLCLKNETKTHKRFESSDTEL